jgi:hypothetical protein
VLRRSPDSRIRSAAVKVLLAAASAPVRVGRRLRAPGCLCCRHFIPRYPPQLPGWSARHACAGTGGDWRLPVRVHGDKNTR